MDGIDVELLAVTRRATLLGDLFPAAFAASVALVSAARAFLVSWSVDSTAMVPRACASAPARCGV
eukprot:1969252-Pyramimonas_sp.AAC.1